MKKLLMVTAIMLSSGTAYAEGNSYGSITIKNVETRQNPFDGGNLNQSPIRGKGAIKVTHTEPAPNDPEAEITKAIRLLTDNGYRIFKQR